MPRLSLRWLPVWLETLLGLWRLRRLLPVLGSLPLVLRLADRQFGRRSRQWPRIRCMARADPGPHRWATLRGTTASRRMASNYSR
jgi:hypothetical protein